MKLAYEVPEWRKIRLIINSDAKNEADDQYAIVHALLTPRFRIRGIIGAQFENTARFSGRQNTMQQSVDEIEKILELMELQGEIPVLMGAAEGLKDEQTPQPSEGAELIIREALADDPAPLYVVFMGPLTDMASALLLRPEIAERLTVIWIGGEQYPHGGWEYNLFNDIHAANVVFSSQVKLWQVPRNVYSTMRVSLAELIHRVRPCGAIGRYLVDQLIEFNNAVTYPEWPKGEMWSLGDSPCISLLLDEHEYHYTYKQAPRITSDMYYVHDGKHREIRVYHYVDPRFTLEDLFAKLALHYPRAD
jgi:inosine-uridine nucleoside N-ribohydrolase